MPLDNHALARVAKLRWIPIAQTRIPVHAQREKINWGRVHRIARELDIEQLGNPTVSHRDGCYWILDGAHRIEGLKEHGYGEQSVQCWCYEELNEADESEIMLKLNDTLTVSAYDRFRIGVNADRPDECAIDRVVRESGCVVSRDAVKGGIQAVGALHFIYAVGGDDTLARTVRIAYRAFDDGGLSSPVLRGIGLVCQRYKDLLNEPATIAVLASIPNGVFGLLASAEDIRLRTRGQKAHCVAAAVVKVINSKRGGGRLPDWWKAADVVLPPTLALVADGS